MFAHLMNRSAYTLLQSTIRLEDLAKKCKDYGYDACALSDHNVLYGVFEWETVCKTHGIKPIYGLEIDVDYQDVVSPFLLLAKNERGLQNLYWLSSEISQCDNGIAFADFLAHTNDCVVIVYGEQGPFESVLLKGNKEALIQQIRQFQQQVSDFYLALSYQNSSLWKEKNKLLKECACYLSVPCVPVNKNYYLDKNDAYFLQIVEGIRNNRTLLDDSLVRQEGRYFLTKDEMALLYEKEDLRNCETIVSVCNVNLKKMEKTTLPSFPTPDGVNEKQYLTQLCLMGLKKRLHGKRNAVYEQRLHYELEILLKMHFERYFLIVYDFICYAKKHDICIGPGRGSAAGSLVSYVLGITMIDPIKNHLLFERFLNPERISMPDIDTDIADNRRNEVIAYVKERYGKDHVANIVTFNTLGPRAVIRDVSKVMNLPARDMEMVLKLISNKPNVTLKNELERNYRLQEIIHANKKIAQVYQVASRLEGLPRHASIHAAGIILSGKPLESVIPINKANDHLYTSQIESVYLEKQGLIKMDFLGLRNLTMIDSIVKKIQATNPSFSLSSIPLNDAKTYALFAGKDTNGIFQFESEGMKQLLGRMKPSCYNDLLAAIALYRPASMDSIPVYLKNRQHPQSIVYPLDSLKSILEETYGVFIYQEQGMLTAQIAAGFSLGKADILRKAMSKKNARALHDLQKDFIDGCLTNHISLEKANDLFRLIEKFAGYGFNKSHAASYAYVAYQAAYLKANYPLYFYSSLIDANIGDDKKIIQYIHECRRKDIPVSAIDIQSSSDRCSIQNNQIILPLTLIKGLSYQTAENIVTEREKQPFEDFFACVARLSLYKMHRVDWENLIQAGALDSFHENRTTLLNNLDMAMNYGELICVKKDDHYCLDTNILSKPAIKKYADDEQTNWVKEREVLGFTLGKDPILSLREKVQIHLPLLAQCAGKKENITIFVRLEQIKTHRTKKGEWMAFIKIGDESDQWDGLVFPKAYARYQNLLTVGNYFCINGKIDDESKLIVETIQRVNEKGI